MSTEVANQTCCQPTARQAFRRPAYNIDENENGYSVEIFVPGVNKAGVEVSLEDDTLTVTASRTNGQTPEGWQALRREIVAADYQLQLEINVPIDRDGISAKVEDGVLNLTLPKAEQAKPRKISVL